MSIYTKGEPVWAKIRGKRIAATIREAHPAHGYKVELEVPNPWSPGQVMRTVYPHWLLHTKIAGREMKQ
jgi:hypothetical protein